LGDPLQILVAADVGADRERPRALGPAFLGERVQRRLIARHQHERCAFVGQRPRRRQADAAGRACENDGLLGHRL
jgi:hypothetical protein